MASYQDDGGGMDPEATKQCMSFGFSLNKSKSAIGQCLALIFIYFRYVLFFFIFHLVENPCRCQVYVQQLAALLKEFFSYKIVEEGQAVACDTVIFVKVFGIVLIRFFLFLFVKY